MTNQKLPESDEKAGPASTKLDWSLKSVFQVSRQ